MTEGIVPEARDTPGTPTPEDIVLLRMQAQLISRCKRCGWCCENCDPIKMEIKDVQALARFLGKPARVVLRRYIRTDQNTRMLSIKKTKPCKFFDWKKKTCKVYEARPLICRSFPFLAPGDDPEDRIGVPQECPAAIEVHRTMCKIFEGLAERPELAERLRKLIPFEEGVALLLHHTRNKLLDEEMER